MRDANIVFGENIRKHRLRLNWTQERLASELEVTPQTVSRWENATTSPDIVAMCALSNVFQATLNSMLGLEDGEIHYWSYTMENALADPSRNFDSLYQLWQTVEEEASQLALNDDHLNALLYFLRGLHDRSETEEQKAEVNGRILQIGERILDFSRNDAYRSYANYNLALYFAEQVVPDRCDTLDQQYAQLSKKYADLVLFKDMHKTFYHTFGTTTAEEQRAAKEKTFSELLDMTKRAWENLTRCDDTNQDPRDEVMQLLCAIEEKTAQTACDSK